MRLGRKNALPTELATVVGDRPEVLATANSPQGQVFALRDVLAVPGSSAWQLIGWHLIVEGGFRPDSKQLWWRLIDGDEGSIQLDSPNALPEVFRERVTASIVMQQRVQTPSGHEAVISARRNLGSDEMTWNVSAVGATDLSDAETRQYLAELTQDLRRDFE